MKAYNENVRQGKISIQNDPFAFAQTNDMLVAAGLENGLVGSIDIPSISCELPLYLGSTTQNMALGATVVCGTSAPLGEPDSNCVIAAHRGYTNADMFRNIEQISAGDEVVLTTLWDTLKYKVVGTEIISPDDTASVGVKPGKDLVTLLTCHPYPYNYQRYLVICEREQDGSPEGSVQNASSSPTTSLLDKLPVKIDSSSTLLNVESIARLAGFILIGVALMWLLVALVRRGFKARKKRGRDGVLDGNDRRQ